jgi:hypothetical protein
MLSRVEPTQDKRRGLDAFALISSTASSVPCVRGAAGAEGHRDVLAAAARSCARVLRSFSAPSAVLGGKNSKLK